MVYDKYLEQLFQKSRGKNYFYIHRDKQKALIAAQPFINTYNQNRNDIYNRMRDRYQKNFLNSINSATNAYGIDILSDASELTESEIVKFISDSLKDFLNQSANNATNKEYIENVQQAYKTLDQILENKKDIQNIDDLLELIKRSTDLLEVGGKELAILNKLTDYKKIGNLRNYLNKIVKSWENKTVTIDNANLASIIKSLNNLVNGLSSKTLKKDSFKGYIKNIFSAQLGEYATSRGVLNLMNETLTNIKSTMVGSQSVKMESDDLKRFKSQYGAGKTTYKTDNKFNHFTITLSEKDKGPNYELDINLGISTKWYKSAIDSNDIQVTIANEKSFVRRLQQAFHYGQLASVYNILAHANELKNEYIKIKDYLVARNLDVLISGFGQGTADFSQFIVVNGEFYSIWDIISILQNTNIVGGSSEYSESGIISVSPSGLSGVLDETKNSYGHSPNLIKAFVRAKNQNDKIKNLEFHVSLHLNKLKNALT